MKMPRQTVCITLMLCLAAALTFAIAGCQPSSSQQPSSATASSSSIDATITFSHESGAYRDASLELAIKNPANLPMVYTTDGSGPTSASERVSGPIALDARDTNRAFIEQLAAEVPDNRTLHVDDTLPTATVVRAAAILPDGTVGPIATNTYFIGEDIVELFGDAMVVSLVVDPADLLDYETGIVAKGAIYDAHREENEALTNEMQFNVQANYTQKGRDWEREAVTEFFDRSNELTHEASCGIRLRGHMSRVYAQKSFNVYLRGSYGMKSLDYDLFADAVTVAGGSPATSFKSFCLRSGGNDTEMLRYRDSLLQHALSGLDFAIQSMRPAIVFLNGEFYGVYSLAEKYSDAYVADHYGVDASNVVIIEDGEIDEGQDSDLALYDELMGFAQRDLADEATWNAFGALVDVQSMADFYAAQIYVGNYDFEETRNCRVWRAREPEADSEYADGRWRWMLFDTEFSCGLYDLPTTKADYDTMGRYLKTCPLFASAMHNSSFRELVRARLVDLSQGAFESAHVSALFDEWWGTWEPWIELSCKRFATKFDMAQWDKGLAIDFFEDRATNVLAFFDKHAAEMSAAR